MKRKPAKGPAPAPDVKNPTGAALTAALEFVGSRLRWLEEETPALLADQPYGDGWETWFRVTWSGIRLHFGAQSEELFWMQPPQHVTVVSAFVDQTRVDAHERDNFAETLKVVTNGLRTIVAKHEAFALHPPPPPAKPSLSAVKAFISHGGMKASLAGIEQFLRALGVEPVVVERSGSDAREVHANVDHYRQQCDFAIVIWTKDTETADGVWIPSGSVSMEAGELREQFGPRVVFLAEHGVHLPTLGSTIVYEPFTETNVSSAFQKIVTELSSWGWLRVAVE
jgi:predicted nucleotide-binding protein